MDIHLTKSNCGEQSQLDFYLSSAAIMHYETRSCYLLAHREDDVSHHHHMSSTEDVAKFAVLTSI